jgi:ParB/RepB/Spo0J family partition protein
MTKDIAIEELKGCPWNPREIRPEELESLKGSVGTHGILQPLLVRPREGFFEIVAGHRRHAAARLAGLREVPCLVREMSDDEVFEALLVENLERKDLTLFEQAQGLRMLMERAGSVARAAKRLGRGMEWVQLRLSLFDLPPAAMEAVRDGRMGAGVAGMLARVPEDVREQACEAAMELLADGMAGEVVEGMIHADYLALAKHREDWMRRRERFVKEVKFAYKGAKVDAVHDPAAAWEEMFYSFGQLKPAWVELPSGWPSHDYRALQRALRAGGSLAELATRHGVRLVVAPAWQDATEYVVVVQGAPLDVALQVSRGDEDGTDGTDEAGESMKGATEAAQRVPTGDDEEDEEGEWDAALDVIRATVEWVEDCDDSEDFILAVEDKRMVLPKVALLAALHGAANALQGEGGEG